MKRLFDTNLPPKLAKTLSFLEGDEGIIVNHLNENESLELSINGKITKVG
jgi:predicted nuclease of predicted toxin-antitoxin system